MAHHIGMSQQTAAMKHRVSNPRSYAAAILDFVSVILPMQLEIWRGTIILMFQINNHEFT